MSKKILIADDHDIVLTGTSLILESKIKDIIIDTAENYIEVLDKVTSQPYDLIILDINMPESKNKKMISEIKEIRAETKILIFSVHDESVALQYIQEGADGYLNKLSKVEEIAEAVKKMLEEGYYYPLKITQYLLKNSGKPLPANPLEKLSEREYQILTLMAKGEGSLEISNILDIRMPTISTYKKRIYKKLGTSNIADLIKICESYSGDKM
ncbi:response regulator transcription factor [uncultured Chryseobacterium sp.]|uniref:response regulator transcription factor n=1 Tax=uncultured Chryseobacterium sp. TaxID=259322 RepID=UPI0025E697AD|nr:response regulator transcription factor [uncultured Chryseobacterium sp.]